MISYIHSWLYPVKILDQNNINLISEKDLLNVQLKPLNVIPAPARNMPNLDKITLREMNKAYTDDILNIKLKKAVINPKKTYYEPRHPVLRELLTKIPIK